MKILSNDTYLFLIDEEAEITIKSTVLEILLNGKQELFSIDTINDIDSNNQFLVLAYYPLNSEAKELDLPLLPPFEREIDINEIAKQRAIDRKWHPNSMETRRVGNEIIEAVKYGYEIAQSKQFSLDDMKKAIEMAREYEFIRFGGGDIESKYTEEEIIQSLSTQQLPSEFILGGGETIEEQIKNGYYIW